MTATQSTPGKLGPPSYEVCPEIPEVDCGIDCPGGADPEKGSWKQEESQQRRDNPVTYPEGDLQATPGFHR